MRTKKKAKSARRKSTTRTPPTSTREPWWNWSKNGKPDPAILADIVQCIVRVADPEKIVLFGSAARGEMGPHSDYDLLVIKGGKFNHWRLLTKIYRELPGTAAVDVVLVTSEDAERYRDTHCLVICPALREGKVVYDSQAVSAGRSTRMAQSSAQQPRPSRGARTRSIP